MIKINYPKYYTFRRISFYSFECGLESDINNHINSLNEDVFIIDIKIQSEMTRDGLKFSTEIFVLEFDITKMKL